MSRPAAIARARRSPPFGAMALLVAPLLYIGLPSVLLVAVGMVPAIVARIVDRRREHYVSFCVACFNFAGTAPFLVKLWTGGQSLATVGRLLSDPLTLLAMYGAAAVGWVAVGTVPALCMELAKLRAQHEVSRLVRRREQLVEEWGEAVTTPMEAAAAPAPKRRQGQPARR